MAFIRCCLFFAATILLTVQLQAQTTVWYPVQASQLLKSTAEDAAMLLQRAGNNISVSFQQYSALPSSGFILKYDSSVTDNQACKVVCLGNKITFSAAEDNGLVFGVYQYLRQLGFRFYQPGTIWEMVPVLASPYKNIDTVFTSSFTYKSWFISGGHNRWIMDNNTNYGWDIYFGQNGHNWALYQRRNGMLGKNRFAGHRGDIINGSYLQTLQNNPCYVACYNNSREASTQSVPDVNNAAAKLLWANAIEQKFTQFKNTVFSNTTTYANYYRNFKYQYGNISIEVPDGARWGNSNDNSCDMSGNYASASNQQFTLANSTAEKIIAVHPTSKMQAYAYATHAALPDVAIHNKIDVMVIPSAFQNESSTKGLMNKWYNKHPNVSEYHYMNIAQWGGEAPMFFSNELKNTLARLKEKASQGIVWEASPAKFASLPFLLAANNDLVKNQSYDASLQEFCQNLFGSASSTIYTLLKTWSSDEVITNGNFIQDNRYKIPYYLQLLKTAQTQVANDAPVVKQRLQELKAYLHYLVLNYNWLTDVRSAELKKEKAAAICLYVAKAHKLQIVNSYFIIQDITSKYGAGSSFYTQYNVTSGTAYQNGSLALLTAEEIENNFAADAAAINITDYKFETAGEIKNRFSASGISPLKKLHVKIGYTSGMDYNNKAVFYIDAPSTGSFVINYKATYNDAAKGYINFVVEDVNKSLGIINDFTINQNSNYNGTKTVQIPGSGTYRLTVVSKFQSSVELAIETKGNYFYKNTAFLGNKTESYRNDLMSLPGYFYVPAGLSKVYFSVNNTLSNNIHAGAEEISKAFSIRDNTGHIVKPALVSADDPSLFYLEVNPANAGSFWQVFKMEQYNLCFANISNILWYAQRKACPDADFAVDFVKRNGSCITQLRSKTHGSLSWDVYDLGRWHYFGSQTVIDLPEFISPYAIITLKQGSNCAVTKRLGEDEYYIKNRQACASATLTGSLENQLAVYPTPTSGVVNCTMNGASVMADEVKIFNNYGNIVAVFNHTRQFNLSHLPAGMYNYKLTVSQQQQKGVIVKL